MISNPAYLAFLFILAFGLVGCEAKSEDADPNDVTFAGTLQASPVQLLALGARGNEVVALLREQGQVVLLSQGTASVLIPPTECSSPVAMTFGDLGLDGDERLLVSDSSCGGWVARRLGSEEWDVTKWDAVLPPLPPSDQLLLSDIDGDGDRDLTAATSFGISVLLRSDAGGWSTFSAKVEPPTVSREMVSTVVLTLPWKASRALSVQAAGAIHVFEPGEEAVALPQVDLELLKPYEGLDQLTPFETPGCDVFALGVGLFVDSFHAPKPLVQLSLTSDGFVATRVQTSGSHVVALASAMLGDISYVGVIEGEREGFRFELLERTGCDSFDVRVSESIDFEVAGVVPQPDTPEQLAHSSGESLVGSSYGDLVVFSHFDGSVLHRFQVDVSTWHFNEEIQRVR